MTVPTEMPAAAGRLARLLLAEERVGHAEVAAAGGETVTVVTRLNLPRHLPDLARVTWEQLCEHWQMRVLGDASAEMFAVELPRGWYLQAVADGSQWSLLYDAAGRERASIFYHAGWDDRCASLYVRNRYSLHYHYEVPGDPTMRVISARDGARIFREFGRVARAAVDYFDRIEQIHLAGQRWLDQEYPGWNDPFAYWDARP